MIFKKIRVISLLLIMLAFSAGITLFCGFGYSLPRGTYIDGIDVGGRSRGRAAEMVRENTEKELKEKKLVIYGGNTYVYSFPEINYRDNLFALLKTIKKAGEYDSGTSYYLCGKNDVISGICRGESVEVCEPYAEFSSRGAPFTYHEGKGGRYVDEGKLTTDVINSLNGGFEPVTLTYTGVNCKKTLSQVREETALLSSFSTNFDGSNLNRASNIRLAAASINGKIIQPRETLSFNQTVGARTRERGYLPAKIIINGEYVDGNGGGVCQVSTTLYNAALLAGLKVTEHHAHTLAVGYVPPSRDAMVSGKELDLKIENTTNTPIYVRTNVTSGGICVKFYGKSRGESYSLESVITGSIPAPEEITDSAEKARDGKDGLTSESYLVVRRGNEVRRVKLRKDKYLPLKKVVYEEKELPENINTF